MKKLIRIGLLFFMLGIIWGTQINAEASKTTEIRISIKKEKGAPYLTWNHANNVDGYEVQVSAKKKGEYSLLEVVHENRYKSSKLVTSKKKYFRVVPFFETEDGVVYGTPSKEKKVNITRVKLTAKCVYQMPELQTGCEASALTTALNYHGFKVSKTTIVDKYMPIRYHGFGNINTHFLGDPYTVGMGIYPKGLRTTANRYLKKQDTNLRAKNISGASIEKICNYAAEGYPVCVWVTCNINQSPSIDLRWTYEGKSYAFSYDEHCVTVIGFDKKKDTIIAANPINGICEYSRSVFAKRYKEMGKNALVIK